MPRRTRGSRLTAGVWAVVVARTGPSAKSRLAPALPPAGRSALAQAMLADVLAACRAAELDLVVVTEDPAGRAAAEAQGALVVADPDAGMNGAVSAGIAAVGARGGQIALVLPGDVPLVAAADLHALIARGCEPISVVVGLDRAGLGTNGLLLRPPTAIEPDFGGASAARHLERGAAAGAWTESVQLPALAEDVDTPADLASIRARATGATARFLS